ncbi:MAG: DUF4405 domain-containing protein [Bacteroidales bacterium]|nr:DUF4405 domain-containing protein [Bacteroidales bacterium]
MAIKAVIDFAMTVLFLILMAYHITGNRLHEWLGVILYLLFILHHLLNLKWYKAILKGKYTTIRIMHTMLNFLLFAAMMGMIISGIVISRDVFGFLNFSNGRFGRRLHMVSAAWGFVLMSAHLGFHWGMVIGMAKKLAPKNRTGVSIHLCRIVVIALSTFGVGVFIFRQIWLKMILLTEYVFLDYEEPAILFFADYISVMFLFACVSYYGMKLLKNREAHTFLVLR